ncbi:hypothetical protein [Nocardia vulneris]|uniref:hypothetical protein n=1 Tax=Nocardia vulneris TaxID=1141657 RepID=UPI0005B7C043|nr:hypothetical protein [Nocardia vulneris]
MGMTGEYLTMAQACGQEPVSALTFVPGEDFDLDDQDEVEVVREATANDTSDRLRYLQDENARLRALIGES